MKDGIRVSTFQAPPESYMKYFSELLKNDLPIIHLAFSSGLSGMYNNAFKVANELNKNSKNKIFVIDSLAACSGQGLLGILSRIKANSTDKLSEVLDYIIKIKDNINHVFTVDTLKYLLNGGRIKATKYVLSEIFNIKPLMQVDLSGRLFVFRKVITRKKTIDMMFNKYIQERDNKSDIVIISHADSIKDALYLKSLIEDKLKINVLITDLGPIIGSHSGPGTLAIYYLGNKKIKYYS